MIKYLIMDVDGTLTDGKIYMGCNDEIMKCFSIKDGCGIKNILPEYDIIPVIITARNSDILKRRCEELDIKECHQSVHNKLDELKKILEKYSKRDGIIFSLQNVAYIGDDLPDLECMSAVKDAGGLVGCPGDAISDIMKISDYICKRNGGDGAVREFIEWLIEKEVYR